MLSTVFALSNAFAGTTTVSGTGTAEATVVSPVQIEKTTNLNFGTVANKAGVVTVSNNGSRTSTTTNLITDGNAPTAGSMKIKGAEGMAITLDSIADSTVLDEGGHSMPVSNFNTNPVAGSLTIPTGGEQPVAVGADLTVSDGQTTGKYTGEYTINVTY